MKKLIERRYTVRQNLLTVVGLCLAVYFCYHLIAGQRSYLRLAYLEHQISQETKAQETLLAQRTALEKKVVMMRPGSINRDLLEEQVRASLGYRYTNETDIILPR